MINFVSLAKYPNDMLLRAKDKNRKAIILPKAMVSTSTLSGCFDFAKSLLKEELNPTYFNNVFEDEVYTYIYLNQNISTNLNQ